MDRIELLEDKIDSAARLIATLRDKSAKAEKEREDLRRENELLLSENKMVRKLMVELDRLRDERKLIKAKCEKLVAKYEGLKI